ncbi:MAG: hypothetical protein LUC16_00040 [Coprobacillus sp.]|nr:hypothetical protein [Coprobacillus sp.]
MAENNTLDNLDSLLEKGQYDLIIKLTEGASDVDSLFPRLLSLYATAEMGKAERLIDQYYDVLKADLPLLIKISIESLMAANMFDVARNRLQFYSSKPYESQEVEELLKLYPEKIKEAEIAFYKGSGEKKSMEEMEKILQSSTKDEEVLSVITTLEKEEVKEFTPLLTEIVASYPTFSVRIYALLSLISNGVNAPMTFLDKDRHKVTLTSADYARLNSSEELEELTYQLNEKLDDPSLVNVAMSLYPIYVLYYFPSVMESDSLVLGAALEVVAHEYMGEEADMESIISKWGVDPERLTLVSAQVKKASDNFK